MLVLLGIITFLAAVALDYADTSNTQAVSKGHAHQAARWSCAMYLIGLVGFYGLTRVSWWLAIPECLGLYVGSWLAITQAKAKLG